MLVFDIIICCAKYLCAETFVVFLFCFLLHDSCASKIVNLSLSTMAHSLIVVYCAFTIFLILPVKKTTHITPKQQLQIHNQSPD